MFVPGLADRWFRGGGRRRPARTQRRVVPLGPRGGFVAGGLHVFDLGAELLCFEMIGRIVGQNGECNQRPYRVSRGSGSQIPVFSRGFPWTVFDGESTRASERT